MQLAEKYRPRSWADVVGQGKIVTRLRALAARGGLAGRAYWLSGQIGTGKTTLAKLIAADVADPFNVAELDAAALSVGELLDLEREMQVYGLGVKTGRAYLVNEAQALRKPVIRQLLVMLERLPAHVAVVFTTTTEGQESLFEDYDDASPLLSRCLRLDLARRDLSRPFAERAKLIAEAEGLDGQPIERYVKLSANIARRIGSGSVGHAALMRARSGSAVPSWFVSALHPATAFGVRPVPRREMQSAIWGLSIRWLRTDRRLSHSWPGVRFHDPATLIQSSQRRLRSGPVPLRRPT